MSRGAGARALSVELTAQQAEAARLLDRAEQPSVAGGLRAALAHWTSPPTRPGDLPRPEPRREPSGPGLTEIAPGEVGVARLAAGETLRIEQLGEGTCVDLELFAADGEDALDAATSEAEAGLSPGAGDRLLGRAGRSLARVELDERPGHDLGHPMCEPGDYPPAPGGEPHSSCRELLAAGAELAGIDPGSLHQPLNLWLPSRRRADGGLGYSPCQAARGDAIELRAERELVAVLCPCGDDVYGSSRLVPSAVGVAGGAVERREIAAARLARRSHVVDLDAEQAEWLDRLTPPEHPSPEATLRRLLCALWVERLEAPGAQSTS